MPSLRRLARLFEGGDHEAVGRRAEAQAERKMREVAVKVGRGRRFAEVEVLNRELQVLPILAHAVVEIRRAPQRRRLAGLRSVGPEGVQELEREKLIERHAPRIAGADRHPRPKDQNAVATPDSLDQSTQFSEITIARLHADAAILTGHCRSWSVKGCRRGWRRRMKRRPLSQAEEPWRSVAQVERRC
jgi:hypothetical protein